MLSAAKNTLKPTNGRHTHTHLNMTALIADYRRHIIGVGFNHHSNGRYCDVHKVDAGGCGVCLIDNREDRGVGMILQLVYDEDRAELPLHAINFDGSLGCRVGFAAKQYATNINHDVRVDVKVNEEVAVFVGFIAFFIL
jgi:hypothetical protein